jgi:flagellar hook-length control protein FliK
LRASATSRTASPAVFPLPQSKTDASKADEASPFALLLNEVASTTAARHNGTQNKDGQASDEETGSDAASQAAPQDAAKPAKPGKSKGNSTGGQDAAADQQMAAQSQAPAQPSTPQISILIAAIAGQAAANNAADKDASADPAAIADVAANGQNNTQSNSAANAPASQGGSSSQTANSAAGQPSNSQKQVQAQVPVPTADSPQPDATQSVLAGPTSQPRQAPSTPQNIVQSNPPQPATVQPVSVQPAPIQEAGTILNSVQSDPGKPQTTPPKGAQTKTSGAQNSVQPDAAEALAVQLKGTQTQTPVVPNSVQLDANQPPAAKPSIQQVQTPDGQNPVAQNTVQPAAKPVKTDKSTSNGGDNSDGNSTGDVSAATLQPVGTQAQTPVQPDASLITTATASVAMATGADDNAGDDEPGVEAAGAAVVAANGPSKAQTGQTAQSTQTGAQDGAQTVKNLLAAQTARQAGTPQAASPQASGQGAASKTGGQPDGAKPQAPGQNQAAAQPDTAQQANGLFAKPWQAKTQDSSAGATGDSGQTNTAGPDDVKQVGAPAPQTLAANHLPAARPPEAGVDNMQVMPGATPLAQQGQGNAAPSVTQNVQIGTPGANMPALAVEISAKSQSGAKQFDIRLDPPELGRVEVRLSIDATGKASAHLSADQPQTLDLLQKDAPALTRALRDAGLNVSQNGLNFSLRQQPGDAGTNSNQNRGGNGRSFTLTATTNLDVTSAGAAYRGQANGRLDIRV